MIPALAGLFGRIGIPTSLRDLRLTEDRVDWVAEQSMGIGRLFQNNPRTLALKDMRRMTVSGHSAGTYLASYLAAGGPSDAAPPPLPLTGLLLLSGIYDLVDIPGSFLKDEAKMTTAEAADWSPLTARQHHGPRRVIALGADETPPFHDQAARLHRLPQFCGIGSEHLVLPGLNHMTVVLDLADPGRPLGARLAAMVEDSRPAAV